MIKYNLSDNTTSTAPTNLTFYDTAKTKPHYINRNSNKVKTFDFVAKVHSSIFKYCNCY